MILPSGIRIRVLRYGWGVSLIVYAFQENSNSIEGLCGNFNNDPSDDFNNGGDKQNHANAASFTRSWRLARILIFKENKAKNELT